MAPTFLDNQGTDAEALASISKIMSRTAPPPPPEKRGLIADVATHFAVGANKYGALPIAGVAEIAGKATGIKPLEDAGRAFGDNAEAWIAQKEKEDPSQKFSDISSIGDAGRWAGEQLVEFAPQAVIGLATGGAGAAAGRAVAGGLARGGVASMEGIAGKAAVTAATRNAGRALAGEEVAALAAKRASEAGAIAATGAGSIGMETSTIYRDQKEGEKDMGKALLYGAAAGALDTAFPAYLMKKTGVTRLMPGMGKTTAEADNLLGRSTMTIGQRLKDTGKIAGLGIGEETVQEGVQTVLENIGANKQVYSDDVVKAGGDFGAFLTIAADKGIRAAVKPEAWRDIVESMATGGLIGGVMGGGSAAAGHIADGMAQRSSGDQAVQPAAAAQPTQPPADPLAPGGDIPAAPGGGVLQDGAPLPVAPPVSPAPPAGPLSNALASVGITPQGVANGVTDPVPALPGPAPLDGVALGVPGLQAENSGERRDLSQPGGLTDGSVHPVRQEVDGQAQEMPAVRSENVDPRVTALEAEKAQIIADPKNKGIAGDVLTPAATKKIDAINKQIQQAQSAPASVVTENKRTAIQDKDSRHYSINGDKGHAVVRVMPDKTAYLTDIQIGYGENNKRGSGTGTKAYQEIAQKLAAEGVVLESTQWDKHQSAISPQALRVWDKLVAAGAAEQVGVKSGKVYNRETGEETVKDIPIYRWKSNKKPSAISSLVADARKQRGASTLPANAGVVPSPLPATTTPLDAQAHEAASSPHNDTPVPTPAQIEAGNYKKGHVELHGLDISIENPAGSTRKGVDETGREWSTDLKHHYGYIKGTVGKDKDHIDVFIKTGVDQSNAGEKVFIVDQLDATTGAFDEHKVMLGFDSLKEATKAYLDNYDASGPERIGRISQTSIYSFRQWLGGNTAKPFSIGRLETATDQREHLARLHAIKSAAKTQGEQNKAINSYINYMAERPWLRDSRKISETVSPALIKEVKGKPAQSGAVKPDAAPVKSAQPTASTAPEHAAVGVSDKELSEIVEEFNQAQQSMVELEDRPYHLFDPPAKNEVVRLQDKVKVHHAEHGWMTPKQAKAAIAEWKNHAQEQGKTRANGDKVVLSLFDLSGQWSQPWVDAGYQVFRFDIQADPDVGDVHNFSTDFFNDWFNGFDGMDIHAILAATPCTDFAVSGARHFAAKDADGRTVSSVKLVHQTLATIEYFKPAVWAIENPVGRIEKLGGLPPWRMSFDPNHVGDPYTKKTLLWGRFNGDMPVAPVEPTEGSKMHAQYGGKSLATKNARSVTPEGFAYAFFMANNAIDNPVLAVAGKYDRLDRTVIAAAIEAGVTARQIDDLVEDYYYQELDDDSAEQVLRDETAKRAVTAKPAPAAVSATPAPARKLTHPTLQRRAKELGYKVSPLIKGGKYDITKGSKKVATVSGLEGIAAWLDKAAQPKVKTIRAPRPVEGLNPQRDHLLVAIAKLGGLDLANAVALWGNMAKDAAEDKTYNNKLFGRPLFRKSGGVNVDTMAELLAENGYLQRDDNGKHDLVDFEDKLSRAIAGKIINSAFNQTELTDREAEILAALTDEDLDAASLLLEMDGQELRESLESLDGVLADLYDEVSADVFAAISTSIKELTAEKNRILEEYDETGNAGEDTGTAGQASTAETGADAGSDNRAAGDQEGKAAPTAAARAEQQEVTPPPAAPPGKQPGIQSPATTQLSDSAWLEINRAAVPADLTVSVRVNDATVMMTATKALELIDAQLAAYRDLPAYKQLKECLG